MKRKPDVKTPKQKGRKRDSKGTTENPTTRKPRLEEGKRANLNTQR